MQSLLIVYMELEKNLTKIVLIGVELMDTNIEIINDFINECNTENITDKIKKFCNKNNLEYKTPRLIIMPTVT